MKITIEIPRQALQDIVDSVTEFSDIIITVEELRDNPKLVAFFERDIDAMYFEDFKHGLCDIDFVVDLDLEKT